MYCVKKQSRTKSKLKVVKSAVSFESAILLGNPFRLRSRTVYLALGVRYVLHKKSKSHST